MALEAKLGRQTKQPWGWESNIKILDGVTVVKTVTVLDKIQKTEAEFISEGRFARLIQNHLDDVAEQAQVPEKTYTESEVTTILRQKGYLDTKTAFSDALPLKTLDPIVTDPIIKEIV